MRFEGIITSWNDDKGFGFIEPTQGGDAVFVHIKALAKQTGRPRLHQRVSFEVELGPQRKKRAQRVEPVTAKFRSVPWVTALLNVAAFVWTCSPHRRTFWQGL